MLRIDVNVPDSDNVRLSGFRQTIRFSGRASLPRRDLGVRPAQSVALQLRRRDARRHRRAGHRRRRPESVREEINYEPRGAGGRNYGWRNREGAHDNVTTRPPAFLPLTDPIVEYGRSDGASVTGGFVYRGSRLGAGQSRAILLCRLRVRPRVVSRAHRSTAPARRRAHGSPRAHGGARRQRNIARQHQLVRRRRRRRALHRQSPVGSIVRITAPAQCAAGAKAEI